MQTHDLLECWATACRENADSHRHQCARKSAISRRIHIPVIALSAVTASSIFSSTGADSSVLDAWQYANGTLAVIVTALSSVSRYLRYDELSEKHRNASIAYAELASSIQCELIKENHVHSEVEDLRQRMTNIRKTSPNIEINQHEITYVKSEQC